MLIPHIFMKARIIRVEIRLGSICVEAEGNGLFFKMATVDSEGLSMSEWMLFSVACSRDISDKVIAGDYVL